METYQEKKERLKKAREILEKMRAKPAVMLSKTDSAFRRELEAKRAAEQEKAKTSAHDVKLTEEQITDIIQLSLQGNSPFEIARFMRIKTPAVRQCLKEHQTKK